MTLGAGNLLDCPHCVQSCNVIRLVPGEEFHNCSEQFGKPAVVPLLQQRMIQLNEHVDGGSQGKDIVQLDDLASLSDQSVCQFQDLKSKPAGVRREGKNGNKVGQETSTLSPVSQL